MFRIEFTYDPEADAGYIKFRDAQMITHTKSLDPNVNLDLDDNNEVVGIEILGLSKRCSLTLPREHGEAARSG